MRAKGSMPIETPPQSRQNILKESLKALGLTVVAASSVLVGDYYLIPHVPILSETYTKYEYEQIKPELIAKMKGNPNQQEARAWVHMVDYEAKRCGQMEIQNYKKETVVEDINKLIEAGRCK